MLKNKILLCCYLYDLQRLHQIESILSTNKQLDIYLGIGKDNKDDTLLQKFLQKHQDRIYNLSYYENYGVDIHPFLHQLLSIDFNKYPYFIKLHSKTSSWGSKKHVNWGDVLIDCLCNSFSLTHNIKILNNKYIGMISHPFLTLSYREINNSNKIKHLCNILNINYDKVHNTKFAAGSMFMSRTELFQKYFNSHYKYIQTLLSTETGKVDDRNYPNGTYCHSLERIFGYICTNDDLAIHPSIMQNLSLYNKQYGKLHLHITEDNACYLVEDLNMYGKIIDKKDNQYSIEWHHFDNKPIVKYNFLTPSIITHIS
jgi:hypothetical protein